MKILVVDDEKMIRHGIVQILGKEFTNEEFIEASNGETALEYYNAEKPDILITDIKMPIMDGIELMKKIRALDSDISIVVVTGFDDFSYARTALQCGASAYILKPIEKAELIETVSQLIKEKEEGDKERYERILGRIHADGEVNREAKELDFLLPYRVLAVLNPVEECKGDLYFISPINHGYLALETVNNNVDLRRQKNTVVGYSREKNSFNELKDATIEALVALFNRFLDPSTRMFYSIGLGPLSNDIADKVSRISNQMGISKNAELEKNVESLFDIPEGVDKAYYLFSVSEAIKNSILSKYSYENDLIPNLISLSSYSSISEWSEDLLHFLIDASNKKKSEHTENPFITKAIKYVEANFDKNINMAVVSNEVGISYTYFSEKFKEHTGINFNDYLTNIRVEKAKELLNKGYYRIYEVSERCGFSGPRYFIKIFKQVTGLTPSAYMNSRTRD